jgi:hypothetical protein
LSILFWQTDGAAKKKKKLSGRGAAEILLAAATAGKKTGCRKDNSRDSPIPCADSV